MAVVSRTGGSLGSSITQVLTRGPAHAGQMEVDFDHAEGGVNHALLTVTPDSFQILRTTRADGQVTTQGSVVVATGKPTLIYHRCSPRRSR